MYEKPLSAAFCKPFSYRSTAFVCDLSRHRASRRTGGKLGLAVRAHLAWTRPDRFGRAPTLAAVKPRREAKRRDKSQQPWICW